MNYRKVYKMLVDNRLADPLPKEEYGEVHHIVPRAEGGSDDASNKVRLSAREHYIAHLLLAKIYDDCAMHCAVVAMQAKTKNMIRNFHFNSRLYEKLKLKRASLMSERMRGNTNGLGYKFTEEQRSAASARLKGKGNPFYGHTHSKESKAKISESCKGHPYNGGGFCNPNTVWWTNGTKTKRCIAQPGPEWRRGRLKKKRSSEK